MHGMWWFQVEVSSTWHQEQYQEYLGRGPAEREKGGGVLPWHWDDDCYRELVPWRFRRRQGGQGQLVGGEVSGVDGVDENHVGGCPQAPAVRSRRTVEVTPTRVGVSAAGHPRHHRRLKPSGRGTSGNLRTDPLPGPGRGNTRARGHPLPVKKAGLDLSDPTKTAPENWTASFVVTGHLIAALRGQEEFRMADHSACLWVGRTVVRKRSVLLAQEALTETLAGGPFQGARRLRRAKKTGGMANVAAIYSKWDRTGCVGMLRCPLTVIWPRYPRPPSLMRQLQHHFFHLPCPWL